MNRTVLLIVSVIALTACASGPKGVRIVNGGTSAVPAQEGEQIRNLGASDVQSALSGKTFQYTRSDGNGFVTYNADGSLSYQDDQRGEGAGRWRVNGDQYCETFGSAPEECGPFKTTGDAYFAANSRLVEINI
jgi:hypothetical protein